MTTSGILTSSDYTSGGVVLAGRLSLLETVWRPRICFGCFQRRLETLVYLTVSRDGRHQTPRQVLAPVVRHRQLTLCFVRAAILPQSVVIRLLGSVARAQAPPISLSYATGVVCPAGFGASPQPSPSCVPCGPGEFSSAGNVCKPCPPGEFSGPVPGGECLPCPPGAHAPAPGHDTCTPCPPGTSAPRPGTIRCAACEPGTVAPSPGLSACQECEVGVGQ